MNSKPSAQSTGYLDDATLDRYVAEIWCGLHAKDGFTMLTPRVTEVGRHGHLVAPPPPPPPPTGR
jgi:hypothetical protein